ncbi:unnamed protein product [Polarella glacialis]|uniref:Uncharacterized protein n=1 Tax=Polarella glacialis TaxID=89957 RepID=A0A813KB63_POLGL|nr:unnamed protein product [Polarella glacialis]
MTVAAQYMRLLVVQRASSSRIVPAPTQILQFAAILELNRGSSCAFTAVTVGVVVVVVAAAAVVVVAVVVVHVHVRRSFELCRAGNSAPGAPDYFAQTWLLAEAARRPSLAYFRAHTFAMQF